MAQYFTSEHFKLLKKWQGVKYDKTNPEQRRVCEELKRAYAVTEAWAKALQKRLFPAGRIAVRKWPISQGQKFFGYNWARIYPRQNAPKGLAYTVSINTDNVFVVKIDTVGLGETSPVKKSYLALRGQGDKHAPFVATLPASEGLEMGMVGLLDWSVAAIEGFKLDYDDVAQRLGLRPGLEQARLLPHFKVNSSFGQLQPGWDDETTHLFVRFANAINSMEFDWWTTRPAKWSLRFGRKEKDKLKGRPIGWLSLHGKIIRVKWDAFGNLARREQTQLTEELVQLVEEADIDGGSWPTKLGPKTQRAGFWPDDFDEAEIAHENDTDDAVAESSADYDMAVVPENQIYYGPPGTGKTYDLRKLLHPKYAEEGGEKRYEFITFHQSYGYEEFIEGLRPVMGQDGSTQAGQVHYEIKPGAFLRLCERARKDKARKYAIVIDEIKPETGFTDPASTNHACSAGHQMEAARWQQEKWQRQVSIESG